RHIGLGRRTDNALFEAANHFDAHRHHHARDDFLIVEIALLFLRASHQRKRFGIFDLFQFALAIRLVAIKADAVLLPQPRLLVHQRMDRLLRKRQPVGKSCRHYLGGVMGSIDTDDIEKIGRAHGPAEFFHHTIDMTKSGAVTHQQTKAREIGKQHAIDEKSGTIVDDDWRLAHFFRVTDNPRDGRIGSALAANHFDQRHAVYRVEEMHAAELLGPLQHAGQLRNRDRRGVAGENGVCIYFSLALSQHALLHLEVFYYSLDDDIECIEALIIQRWANTRQHT